MNIILLGYRGSGKTSIGKKLAAKLWKDFVDIDQEIRNRFRNRTVAEIWAEFGEPEYRKVEVEVTKHFCAKKNAVIALGGGTLMQPGAHDAVKNAPNTIRIYLKCDADELNRRINGDAQSAGHRPSLTKHGGGIDEINAVLAVRGPVYEEVADKVFDVSHVDIDGAVRHLLEKCV